jgi:signal peptidase II
MLPVKRAAVLLLVLIVTVGCDQVTKATAQRYLSAEPPITYLNGLVTLQYAENSGAFLSLGARLPEAAQLAIFTVAAALMLAGILAYTLRSAHAISWPVLWGLALMLAGGVGNLIDRLTNDGRVIDFVHVGVGSLRTGIFNVADMALTTGVIVVAIASLRPEPGPPAAVDQDEAAG